MECFGVNMKKKINLMKRKNRNLYVIINVNDEIIYSFQKYGFCLFIGVFI